MPAELHTLPADPLNKAIMNTIRDLARFRPNPIRGSVDPCDLSTLADDLKQIADIIDPLIRAYGDHAAYNHNISPADIQECFGNVMRGAIDGNATFVLEKAAAELSEQRRPAYRPMQAVR